MTPHERIGRARALALLLAAVSIANALWFGTKAMTETPAPSIHVMWKQGISDERQHELEAQFLLVNRQPIGPPSYAYDLLDSSPENIAALVKHPEVRDTHEIDRDSATLSPGAPKGRASRWIIHRVLRDDRIDDWIGRSLQLMLLAVFISLRYVTG